MRTEEKTLQQLTHELFYHYPDYGFCRTLASNIKNNTTTYETALEILAQKFRAIEKNRKQIEQTLAQRKIRLNDKLVPVKELSLFAIMRQNNQILKEIVELSFKHPFIFGRTKKTRILPRWIRTFFLSALLGHAKSRGLELDYEGYFDMLTLL